MEGSGWGNFLIIQNIGKENTWSPFNILYQGIQRQKYPPSGI
jgi:hypothetical protein